MKLTARAGGRVAKGRQRLGYPDAILVLHPPHNAEAYYPLDETNVAWEAMWKPIADMQRACRERGGSCQ